MQWNAAMSDSGPIQVRADIRRWLSTVPSVVCRPLCARRSKVGTSRLTDSALPLRGIVFRRFPCVNPNRWVPHDFEEIPVKRASSP